LGLRLNDGRLLAARNQCFGMNWVFLDVAPWDYDVATPLARPLGGSQSAFCYLAAALARRGEQVTTLTATTDPRIIDGVRCLRYGDIPADVFSAPNTVTVVLNGPPDIAGTIRSTIPHAGPLVLWTQHAHDQPIMQPLRDPACFGTWDRVVCISNWQRAMYHEHFGVPLEQIDVLRNAIGPMFSRLFTDASDLAQAKSQSLRLAYTSTPFRGLNILVACFPTIHRLHPDCRLDVFSSMAVYGNASDDDFGRPLYDLCRTTEGIDYRGSVTQPELAQALRGAKILAYPNTFAETGCIAAMEALAAGMLVISSDLGALPETCEGWGRLISPIGPGRTPEQYAIEFVRVIDEALRELNADPTRFFHDRFRQSQAITASCDWDVRAAEWQHAAARWLQSQ
jgi:glycosyltransferase involved in cell wall biosynthesis